MAQWMVKKRKAIEDGLLIASRTLCKAFMDFSLPRDNVKMEKAVMGDVSRAYATMSKIYLDIRSRDPQGAEAFWYFQKIGKYSVAQKIMAIEFEAVGIDRELAGPPRLRLAAVQQGTHHRSAEQDWPLFHARSLYAM